MQRRPVPAQQQAGARKCRYLRWRRNQRKVGQNQDDKEPAGSGLVNTENDVGIQKPSDVVFEVSNENYTT